MKKWLLLFLGITLSPFENNGQNCNHKLESAHSDQVLQIARQLPISEAVLYDIPCISPVQPRNFERIRISSEYGYRVHPITQRIHKHLGIDIPPTGNDTIYATANGCIDTIAYDEKLGLHIRIQHRFGYATIYGHLSRTFIRAPHQEIRIGQPIAIMGTTGRSTGKHLHYTILHHGQNVPPLPYCYLFIENRSRLE